MVRVLFVCTGNTCRSPMARAAFLHLCAGDARLAGRVEAQSAGLWADLGAPMSGNAKKALAAAGIPVPEHGARGVDEGIIAGADLVLALTRGHGKELLRRFPAVQDKMFVLGEADIPDPFGGDEEQYRACLVAILNALTPWVEKLYGRIQEKERLV